jgi:hypothetical protein
MVPSLDIFKIESDDLRWCEAAANMETAKARIEKSLYPRGAATSSSIKSPASASM